MADSLEAQRQNDVCWKGMHEDRLQTQEHHLPVRPPSRPRVVLGGGAVSYGRGTCIIPSLKVASLTGNGFMPVRHPAHPENNDRADKLSEREQHCGLRPCLRSYAARTSNFIFKLSGIHFKKI